MIIRHRIGYLWLGISLLTLLGLCAVRANEPEIAGGTSPDIPPLGLQEATDLFGMPGGQIVSQPLQAVYLEESNDIVDSVPDLKQASAEYTPILCESKPLRPPYQKSWVDLEYLVWWPRPLQVSNRPMIAGNGSPTIDQTANYPEASGGRFRYGWSLNSRRTAGMEVVYTFLGPRSVARHDLTSQMAWAKSWAEVGPPPPGQFYSVSSVRVSGWEVHGVGNLIHTEHFRLDSLAGYRYLEVNEGTRAEGLALLPDNEIMAAYRQQDGRNRFHGGQFGLSAGVNNGPVFVQVSGKVGIGQTQSTLRQQAELVNGTAGNLTTNRLAYAEGQDRLNQFAVLPEAAVTFGYQLRSGCRLYMGYNFLLLSEVVRPSELLWYQVPQNGSSTAFYPATQSRTDFWAQGITFGLKCRY